MAKLYVSEAFVSNSMDAIRIHGALGYLTDYQVERDLRDATAGVIIPVHRIFSEILLQSAGALNQPCIIC